MKYIVGGFSGGIDSQAATRFMLNRYGPENVLLLNTEAGRNELSLTVAHTRYYREQIHPITEVVPKVGDIWDTAEKPAEYGLDPEQELTFELLAKIKGRFPSKRAQFCTEHLKIRPIRRWLREHHQDSEYAYFTGVRRSESESRKNTPFETWNDFLDCKMLNPIADWTKEMCFTYVKEHGELVNPLYKMGFARVGCKCVNGKGKDEILALLRHFPEEIDAIRGMEKRTGFTYFAPCVPGMAINWIDDVIAWAKTDHGADSKTFSVCSMSRQRAKASLDYASKGRVPGWIVSAAERVGMKRIGYVLCRLGLHRWKWVAMDLFGNQAYMCTRPYCRTCRQFHLSGAWIYWERDEQLPGDMEHHNYPHKDGPNAEQAMAKFRGKG